MPHDLLSEQEAIALLGPHATTLRDCIDRAWSRWLINPDHATASKRSRASVVYDYIVDEVQRVFADTPGIRFKMRYQSLHMTVESIAVIKFKKFRGKSLLTSGISTNTRNLFLAQGGLFQGMVVTHLVAGYLLDSIEQAPQRIALVCPLEDGNLWSAELGDSGGQAGGTLAPLNPTSPDDSDGTTIRSTRRQAADDAAVNEE